MKNKYLTKQQKNDIAVSILYDWSFGNRDYPSIYTVASRISIEFTSQFDSFNIYVILSQLRTMMNDISNEYILLNCKNINPALVETYAKENSLHISPMKVITP